MPHNQVQLPYTTMLGAFPLQETQRDLRAAVLKQKWGEPVLCEISTATFAYKLFVAPLSDHIPFLQELQSKEAVSENSVIYRQYL